MFWSLLFLLSLVLKHQRPLVWHVDVPLSVHLLWLRSAGVGDKGGERCLQAFWFPLGISDPDVGGLVTWYGAPHVNDIVLGVESVDLK